MKNNKLLIIGTAIALAISGIAGVASRKAAKAVYAADETVAFDQQGYSNQQEITSYVGTDFSISFNKGSNSNAPKYYTSGSAIRMYGGNYMVITGTTKTIAEITLTFGTNDGTNAISADSGTWASPTWTGSANSVKLTIGGSSGNRRLAGIDVTFSNGTPQPSTYSIIYDANTTDDVSGMPSTVPNLVAGTYDLDDEATPSRDGYTFGGWASTANSKTPITQVTITNANVTVYAIWNRIVVPLPSSGSFDIDVSYFSGSSYGPNDGEHTTTLPSGADVIWVSSNVSNSTGMQFKKSGGTIYNTTDLGNIISVDIETSDNFTITYGASAGDGCTDSALGAGIGFFKITNNSSNAMHASKITVSWGTPKTVVAWSVTGSIGNTYAGDDYDLSGLTLHAWYDSEKTDEASPGIAAQYKMVANPATAGNSANANNVISVEVYLASDEQNTDVLAVFENIAAPIVEPDPGTRNNPFTVAQAIAHIDSVIAGGTSSGNDDNYYYVAGIVSQIVTPFSSEYGNISYNISDDGLTTSAQLQAYRGKNNNGDAFESSDDVEVGGEAVISGKLTKYGQTYEFTQNNWLVSYTAPAPRTLTSITLSGTYQTIFYVGDQFNYSGLEVTANFDDDSHDDVSSLIDISTPDMSTAGTKSVTVSYTFKGVPKSATYDIVVRAGVVTNFELYGGASLVEGDYLITYDNAAMNVEITKDRAQFIAYAPANNVISTATENVVWHIAPSGNYFTIYNKAQNKYLASTGVASKIQLLANGSDEKALWSVEVSEGTFDFVNKYNSENQVNASLRKNDTYGFSCYSDAMGGALSLYRSVVNSVLGSAYSIATLHGTESNGEVSDVAIRFGARIPEATWNALTSKGQITDYGMMLVKKTTLNGYGYSSVEAAYLNGKSLAISSKTDKADYEDPYFDSEVGSYFFTLRLDITKAHNIVYCAAPFVVVGGQHYFLQQMEYSVNTLAQELAADDNYPYLSADALTYLSSH